MSRYIKNDNGSYVCPNCNIVKKNQNTMYYHMKKHDGKLDFECNICAKEFLQKSALALHMSARHKTKEVVDMYKCIVPNCEFESLTKGNRRTHCMRKHFKLETDALLEENNTCSCCKESFPSTSAFYYHSISCVKTDDIKKQSYINLIH